MIRKVQYKITDEVKKSLGLGEDEFIYRMLIRDIIENTSIDELSKLFNFKKIDFKSSNKKDVHNIEGVTTEELNLLKREGKILYEVSLNNKILKIDI